MSSSTLSEDDVAELVLEYLSTSGFSESENAFRKERARSAAEAAKMSNSPKRASSSRLEVFHFILFRFILFFVLHVNNRERPFRICWRSLT